MSAKSFSPENHPLIYLITDGSATVENFPRKSREIFKLIETAVESKIDLIQIREKKLTARLIFELVSQSAAITRHSSTKLLVNDRADIALAARADGAHLTSVSLPVRIVRQSFPPDFIVGASAHSFSEAESARLEGANFVAFSPIYDTPSKQKYNLPPQGLKKLKQLCERLKPFPVVALGGIDETNYAEVLGAGAGGFAAIRFLNDAENLRKLTFDLKKA